jgi:hypothetical protein
MYTSATDVMRIVAERGHDLATVRMPDDDRRAVLEIEHLAQSRDIVGERRQWELGRRDPEAVGLEALDDPAPTGSVRPSAVDENDVRSPVHLHASFSGAFTALAGGRAIWGES